MMLGKSGRYIGGLLLFIGLLFLIVIMAGFSSGFLSHSFAQTSVSTIVNYTVQQDQLSSVITPVNTTGLVSTVTPVLNSKISYINCGMGCLASSFIQSSTGISIPMDNIDLYHYELLSLALVIAGIILIFFSYRKERKLTAIGKNAISVSIISLVLFYIPFAYIIPILVTFPVSSYSLRIPSSVFAAFTGTLLFMDLALIIIGAILLVTAAIITRVRKNPVQSTGTKLIVTQK